MHRILFMLSFVPTALVWTGCGGCPWTDTTDVSSAPDTPCIVLTADDGSDLGGCVHPTLRGTNTCAEVLTFPAEYARDQQALEVAPGADFAFIVDLATATDDGDELSFAVPAILGTETIQLTFRAD